MKAGVNSGEGSEGQACTQGNIVYKCGFLCALFSLVESI